MKETTSQKILAVTLIIGVLIIFAIQWEKLDRREAEIQLLKSMMTNSDK